MLNEVLNSYNIIAQNAVITPFGNGLINSTFKIDYENKQFILQKINETVFKSPLDIDANTTAIGDYLKANFPTYNYIHCIKTTSNETMVFINGNDYYRLLPFVANAVTLQVVTQANQAYEAALQFGKFTNVLTGFNGASLKNTIPNFHDLNLRFLQFCDAIIDGNEKRIALAKNDIKYLLDQEKILTKFNYLVSQNHLLQRVTHHDTKISNVLFNNDKKGLAVIDLDTVMNGYFISDVGDMMRTYTSPTNEEATNFGDIFINLEMLQAIKEGYLQQMQPHLHEQEIAQFNFSGVYMMYMQALRFMTDFLRNDVYYKTTYDLHNYNRAKNQITLLQRFLVLK